MIQIKGYEDVMKRLIMLQTGILPITEEATQRAMDVVQDLAMKALEAKLGTGRWGGTWSRGDDFKHIPIASAWEHSKGQFIGNTYMANLTNNSDHACIVNGGTTIVMKNNKSKEVCSIKVGDYVLCKDGDYHKVIVVKKDLTVEDKPNLVRIKTEKGYAKEGLIVTDDHLILAWNSEINYPYWIQAKHLNKGDTIVRKIKTAWNKDTGIILTCKNCGKDFHSGNSGRQKYCCWDCYVTDADFSRNEGMHWELTDEQCKKHTGKNNPAWKDGASIKPYGYGWTDNLRRKVKERDNYICQRCGFKDDLCVHHIDMDKFHNTVDNLITLCRSCHAKLHWEKPLENELVNLNLYKFQHVKITEIEKFDGRIKYSNHNRYKMMKLYDIQVEDENSFIAMGIVVHNSAVEFGTVGPIRPTNAYWLDLGEGTLKKWVKGQAGYHYLTEAINRMDNIKDVYVKTYRDFLRYSTIM